MRKHFLIIGLGSIGKRHAMNLISLGHSVSVLHHRSIMPSSEIDIKAIYNSVREAFQETYDGVIVCTPTSLHLEYLKYSLQQNVPVLLEKPISHNFEQIEVLRKLIQDKQYQVMMGFNFRYHPQVQRIREMLRKKILGQLLYANIWWCDDLRTWYPQDRYLVNYASNSHLGGGALLTICHEIDLALWLFGEPLWVDAFIDNLTLPMKGVDDYFKGTIQFQDRPFCQIQQDFITKLPDRGMRITGETGSLKWDYFKGTLTWKLDGCELEEEDLGPITPSLKNQTYIDEIQNFIDFIENKIANPVPFEDGIKVQWLIEKFKEAHQKSSRVNVGEKL